MQNETTWIIEQVVNGNEDTRQAMSARYLREDTASARALLVREMLHVATTSVHRDSLTLAIDRNTGIEYEIYPNEIDGPLVVVRAAGDHFAYSVRPVEEVAGLELENRPEAEASDDDDDDTYVEEDEDEPRAIKKKAPGIDEAAYCSCGHKGNNHYHDGDVVACRVCGVATTDCQKLVA